MHMKAALWYGRKDIRIEEIDEPGVKPGYVKIKVKCCGICGSDLHEYVAGPILISEEPHPLTGEKPPVVIGHEFTGEVVEVGPKVTRVRIGDRVAVDAFIACGQCYFCQQGDYRLCTLLGFNGFHGITGGFAEYTVAPEYQLYKIPEDLSYEAAALSDPVSVAVHAMARGEMLPGKKVGIFETGTIGLSTIQVARSSGASFVVASELSQTRREFSRKFGANLILNPLKENIVETILEHTEGLGLDIVFECAGTPPAGVEPALLDAIASTKKGSTLVVVSVFENPVSLDMNMLFLGEKRIVFSLGYKDDFPAAMALMADGRIYSEGMITKKIRLSDLVSEGFEELVNNLVKHIKIMVYPE